MKHLHRKLSFALLPWAAGSCFGQQTGISGRISDASGAIVSEVKVSARAQDGTAVSTLTNREGLYQFPALRAETYLLRFEAAGFAPAERTITLLVGQVPTTSRFNLLPPARR